MSSLAFVRILLRFFGLMNTLQGLLALPAVLAVGFPMGSRIVASQIIWQAGFPVAILATGLLLIIFSGPLAKWIVKTEEDMNVVVPDLLESRVMTILIRLFGLALVILTVPEFVMQAYRGWAARDLSIPVLQAVQVSFLVVPTVKALIGVFLVLKGDALIPIITRPSRFTDSKGSLDVQT